MDVTKTLPPGLAPPRAGTASSPDEGVRSPAGVAVVADRADIRPLDIPAALQILLAEVRAAFELTALSMGTDAGILADSPPQAARAILQVFLQAVPENAIDVPTWAAAVESAETSLQAGLERASAAIAGWREVPAIVIDAAKEVQASLSSALNDDLPNPLWLRPEWAGLAPRLEKFCRRRRFARRHLSDPDYPTRKFDDDIHHGT
jgi:hypothetical protein